MTGVFSKRIVIKVGGAALFHPNGFRTQLKPLLQEFEDWQVFLVAGGGDLIESMRSLHRIYPEIADEHMHWRCVDLLRHSWELASELMPLDQPIGTHASLQTFLHRAQDTSKLWVCANCFYSSELLATTPDQWRPASNWGTTTDSIAWLLAMTVSADKLLLMKQCPCNKEWSLEQAGEMGIVDSELVRLVKQNQPQPFGIELRSSLLLQS